MSFVFHNISSIHQAFMGFIKKYTIPFLLFLLLTACSAKTTQDEIVSENSGASSEVGENLETPAPTSTEEIIPSVTPTETQPIDSLSCIPTDTRRVVGRVVDVLDGDTIKVRVGTLVYTVRYIGIDAPSDRTGIDDYEYYGNEATQRNKELVDDQTVTMIRDVSDLDNFGRLVRYVTVNDTFVNYELASQGYARAYLREPDLACQEVIDQVEEMASEQKLGLWGEGEPSSVSVSATEANTQTVENEVAQEPEQTSTPITNPVDCIPDRSAIEYGEVVDVVDGDTIRVIIDGEVHAVRYIGVDAPDAPSGLAEGDYYGEEAMKRNEALINKKQVMLFRDQSDMDHFGRKLRYVLLDDLFVNYDMISRGYALAYERAPDTSCQEVFQQAEIEARDRLSGVWLFWSLPVVDENATPVP